MTILRLQEQKPSPKKGRYWHTILGHCYFLAKPHPKKSEILTHNLGSHCYFLMSFLTLYLWYYIFPCWLYTSMCCSSSPAMCLVFCTVLFQTQLGDVLLFDTIIPCWLCISMCYSSLPAMCLVFCTVFFHTQLRDVLNLYIVWRSLLTAHARSKPPATTG